VTSYFQTIFGLWYLRVAEGARPDVILYHRHFLAYPGYREQHPTAPEPQVVEYDLDLPDELVAQSQTLDGEISAEPQARRFAAWNAFLAAHRACRLDDPAAQTRALEQARQYFPELQNCDRVRAPDTIAR
jgi:hypothetical protein